MRNGANGRLDMRGAKVIAVVMGAILVASSAQGQRARQKMAPVPIGDPAQWFPPDAYPPDAIRASRSGRVVVSVGVDSAGKVVTCAVAVSSGTTSLDQRTCALALASGRFDPATDRRGRSVASIYKLPVRWVVPSADDKEGEVIDLAAPFVRSAEIEWIIGTDGRVESCKAISPHAIDTYGACKRFPPGADWGARFTTAGQPVRAVVRDRSDRIIKAAALPELPTP